MTLTLPGLIVLIIIAAICGTVGKAYETKNTTAAVFGQVLMADELNDIDQRDALLYELRTQHQAKAPESIKVLGMLASH